MGVDISNFAKQDPSVAEGSGWRSIPSWTGNADGTQINIALASLGGPGVVFLPAGTAGIDTPVILDNGQYLVGESRSSTILRANNGLNANVVQSANFASLTGTNVATTGVPSAFGLRGLTIDGNKANNTSGHGIALYGYNYTLDDFTVRNCAQVGLWLEWATLSSGTTLTDSMESYITRFKVHDCKGVVGLAVGGVANGGSTGTAYAAGILFMGPHDSHFDDGIVYNNGTGSAGTGNAHIHCPLNNYVNGSTFDNIHTWGASGGNDYGLRTEASGLTLGLSMQMEGATVAQLWLNNSSNRVYGKYFGGSPSIWGTTKGIVLGANGNLVYNISGVVKVENCGGGAVDFTWAGDNNHLDVHASYTSVAAPSPVVIGTAGANSYVNVHATNQSSVITSDTALYLPSGLKGGGRTFPAQTRSQRAWRPTASLRDNMDRLLANTAEATLTSGTLFVFKGPTIYQGDTISNIAVKSGTTAGATLSNQWFCLLDQSLNVLCKTVDDTTTAWGAFALKTLVITGNYVPASDFDTYIGVLVAATTPPSLRGASVAASLAQLAPVLMGTSTTGLTNPASLGATAAAITQAGSSIPYAYVTGSTTLPY